MLELVVSRTLDREREYTGTSESLHQQHFASTALLLLMLLMTADDAAAADDDDDPAAESPPRRHPVLTRLLLNHIFIHSGTRHRGIFSA